MMESEIANYCINHIQNGLSFGHVINMNTGVQLSEEEITKHRTNQKSFDWFGKCWKILFKLERQQRF